MKKVFLSILISLSILGVQAQFTAGKLVVNRIGDGTTAAFLSTSTIVSAPINLYEFNTTGASQAIPGSPKVAIGSVTSGSRLTVSGGRAGEGQLNLSADGKYLSLIGYDQPTAVAEATCTAGNKVIVRINNAGTPEYSTSFPSGNANTLSAATTDGSSFYTSIDAIGYIPWNQATAPTTVYAAKPIGLGIINSQLYFYENYGNVSYTNTALPTATSTITPVVKLSSSLDGRGFTMLNSDANTSTGYSAAGYDVLYVSNKTNGLEKYFWNAATATWLPANSQFQLRIDITNGGSGYTTAPAITIGETWTATVTYATNQFVCNRTNGRFYQVTTGGTSGTVIPSVTSGTVTATGGTAVYTYRGYTPSATAILTAGVVTSIDLTPKNAQQFVASPYTMVAPPVTIGAPASGVQATLNAYYPTVPFFGAIAALTANLVNGNPVIYALTGDGRSTNNSLIAITDASGSASAPMTGSNSSTVYLAAAGANYSFKGVAFAPTTGNVTTTTTSSALGLSVSTSSFDITVSGSNTTLSIDNPINVHSITVAPGAKLTLNTGKTLTATSGVTLQSDATGTGTLVDNTIISPQAITATVQQYMPQGRNWYLSSPITTGNTSSLTATGTGSSVSYYDEPTSNWVNSYTGALTSGIGYVAVSNSGTGTNNVQFSGTLNTGTVTVPLTMKGSTKAGFNLIANPYPSYLNPMAAINANANLVPTIWYRTQSTGITPTYYFETVNTTSGVGTNAAGAGTVTGYIPPMQAFWVRTNLDNQTLTFDNSMRFHAGNVIVGIGTAPTTPMKAKSQINQQLLRLQVSNGTNNDEAVVYSNSNAADTYDAYDSPKMTNANPAIPMIYTTAGTEQLVINGLNRITPNEELSLGFTSGAANNFSIKLTELSNFDAGIRIILKDNQTNTEQDITDGTAYPFNSDAVSTASRFKLVFRASSVTTDVNNAIDNNNSIFVFKNANNQIEVNISTEIVEKASVSVFNAVGQKLENKQLKGTVNVLNNSYTMGVYFVSVLTKGKTITRKIVID